jgi:hypothetical protein
MNESIDANKLWRRHLELHESNRGIRFGFISTELDLAITFCEVALGTRSHERFARNIANAQTAYIAAKHFMNDHDLTVFERDRIREQILQLDELLGQLNGGLDQPKGAASDC